MKRYLALVFLVLVALVGCNPTTGRLEVTILGLPSGAAASVQVVGLQNFAASAVVENVPAATYAVVGYDVVAGAATYRASLSAAAVQVAAGQTAQLQVAYTPVAGGSATATLDVSAGGSLSLGAATLTVPPDAFEGVTSVTLTLESQGQPSSSDPGDPLDYVSTAYAVSGTGTSPTGQQVKALRIRADNPPSLSILPSPQGLNGFQTLIVGSRDPNQPQMVRLDRPVQADEGPKFAPVTDKYLALDRWQWVVGVPVFVRPTEGSVLQVPWYYQSGIPWCAPTSLDAMLRFYDFTETGVDSLNASFGASTALANWQLARAQTQPRDSGGGWPFDQIGLAGKYTIYLWDADDFVTTGGAHGGYDDFMVYTTLVNTGVFGLIDRRPLVMIVDNWWHSVTVVGVDGTGLYYHDSNGPIAHKSTWEQFQEDATGWKEDDHGDPVYVETIWTGVMNLGAPGVTIKPENHRRGSMVLSRGDISFRDVQENVATLEWDGANPHVFGYYFNSPAASPSAWLGAFAMPGAPLNYRFRVANVTNVSLNYSAEVTLASADGTALGSPMTTTLTVSPYSLSTYTTGTFTLPSRNANPAPGLVRLRLFQNQVLQDVKFVRFHWPVYLQ
jgi:hypothetical protein